MRKLPATPSQYLSAMRRRWKWFIIPAVIIPIVAVAVGKRLPKEYKSETQILVTPQPVPADLVRSTVQTDMSDRLQMISATILSRPRLLYIVDTVGLAQSKSGSAREDAATKLRKDITLEVLSDEHSERTSAGLLKISYVAATPELAQRVTQAVANMSISDNLQSRDQQAQGTTLFMQSEVEKAHEALLQQEAKLSQFRAQHGGSLPEQEASNLQLISQYQSMEQANSEAIDRAHQQRVYVQSMLDASGVQHGGAPVAPPTQIDIDLQRKRDELRAAKQKYTDNHPDVLRLEADVNSLQQQALHQTPGVGVVHVATGITAPQQLQSQLVSIQTEIASRTQRQAQLEAKVQSLQGRVEGSPAVQGQFASLQRDYETAQKTYQALVEKQQSSSMSAELERTTGKDQFQVLDPASLPKFPSRPNLLMVDAAGLFAGLFFGLALAVGVELFDQTIHEQDELPLYFEMPLIAAIPTFTFKS